ncbi:regulator of microtubule dynamics protein 1-like [Littorina saxatilis]|uniref:Regulator of microtubule dynamics protein 1 n=1 Tax=Littorina saxatilis TaxID=31220 RepID=A0AAN9GQH9_9CAEN
MASRAASFFRALRTNCGSLKSRANVIRQQYVQYVRRPHLLLVVPAAGILRSLTFFKSNEQAEAAEPQQSKEAARITQIITEADSLYDSHNFKEVLAFLREHVDVENDEVLWRLARALSDNSKLTDDKALKKQLLFEAFDVIKRALALNDMNFACHKWYAILMDKTAELEGTKARISNAYVVKDHFMKASELNPKDATTLYTLGVWCFLFADMPWYQRKIASALFASPPTSTYEEALNYFHKAEEMEPNFYSKNLMMLGKAYSRLGNKKLAMLYLTRALEFPINTPDDRDAHKEAEELLTKMGVKRNKEKGYGM